MPAVDRPQPEQCAEAVELEEAGGSHSVRGVPDLQPVGKCQVGGHHGCLRPSGLAVAVVGGPAAGGFEVGCPGLFTLMGKG